MAKKRKIKDSAGAELKLGYQIVKYEVGAYSSEEYDGPASDVEFEIGVEYLLHESIEKLLVKVTIGMLATIAGERKVVVKFIGNAFFNIEGLKGHVKDQVEFSMPEGFTANIANIAVSTSRGVLLMKNSGTKYAGKIMPVIPTENLIPKTTWKMKNFPNLGIKTE